MTSSPFVGEWTIIDWALGLVKEEDGGIPADSFQVGGSLRITQLGDSSFGLEWSNERNESCSVPGLQPGLEDPEQTLTGHNLLASFGEKKVECTFDVFLHPTTTGPKTLTVAIKLPEPQSDDGAKWTPNVGSGTVTATANPEPPLSTDTDAAGKR